MIWLVPALLFAVLDLFAMRRRYSELRSFTRPLVAAALVLWFYMVVMPVGLGSDTARMDISYVFWALIFLLAAETLAMGSSPRMQNIWLARLSSIALFSVAFGGPVFPARYLLPGLLLAAMVLACVVWVFLFLAPRFQEVSKVFAALYALLVATLLLSAASTLVTGWGMVPSYIAIAGAFLWYLAAVFEGWHRFAEPLTDAEFRLRLLFLTGQLLLAAGAGMQALGLLDFTI